MATIPYRPSNGTEGDIFMARFCANCERDKDFQDDLEMGVGCPLCALALAFPIDDRMFPKEWVADEDAPPGLIGGKGARCTAFVERGQEIPYRCDATKDLFQEER